MPNPSPTYSNEAKVTINGLSLNEIDASKSLSGTLGACWVECSMNLPTAFHIMFTDNYQKYIKDFPEVFKLGARIAVYAVADGQGEDIPLVTGEITGIEADYDSGTTSTVIRGLDHSFKMMRRSRTKGYEDQTATEIVRYLAGQDGVLVGHVESSITRYKMITQPNISDWQFVNELAYRNGMFVDFDNRGYLRFRRLPVADAPLNPDFPRMPTILKVGGNVRRCRTGITSADQSGSVTVRGWDMEVNDEVSSTMEAVTYEGRVILATPALALEGGLPHPLVETSTPYGSQSEVTTTADARAGDISAVFAELEVLADGNPALVPGRTVQLSDAGESFDGLYTVTTARHEFAANGHYTTWVSVTGRQVRNVYGLASGASGPSSRIAGVVNALVTDISDPERKGRVRVKFPWLDNDYQSRWARTMQYGGMGGGGVINPAVGDEVLVAFDRGDINYPYVLGGLYGHKTNLPSEHDTALVTGGHLNRQSLVSRAGHRLELLNADEGVPKHGVRLQSGDKKLTVFLDQVKTEITIESDGKISIKGRSSVSVTSDRKISIAAPKISIDGDVTIDGTVNLVGDLSQVGGDVKFETGVFNVNAAVVGIDSAAAVVVSAVGPVQLKGTPVAVAPFPPVPG